MTFKIYFTVSVSTTGASTAGTYNTHIYLAHHYQLHIVHPMDLRMPHSKTVLLLFKII